MTHLSDEQLEDVLQGRMAEPDDLDAPSRQRLTEHRAIRSRLRSAFASVQAGDQLAARIRGRLAETAGGERRTIPLWRHRFWRHLLAAAAVLLIAIPVVIYLSMPEPAGAAQARLFRIHQDNLTGAAGFHRETDPDKIATDLRNQLGYSPALPRADGRTEFKGCCIAKFRRRSVASYLIQTPRGPVSVIVLPDEPESLRFGRKSLLQGRTCWSCSHGSCNMAAVRLGGYTYCAIGEVPHEQLREILARILQAATLR